MLNLALSLAIIAESELIKAQRLLPVVRFRILKLEEKTYILALCMLGQITLHRFPAMPSLLAKTMLRLLSAAS